MSCVDMTGMGMGKWSGREAGRTVCFTEEEYGWEDWFDWLILRMDPGRGYLRQREESFRTAGELLGGGEERDYIHEAGWETTRVCGEPKLNRKKSRSGARLMVWWGLS